MLQLVVPSMQYAEQIQLFRAECFIYESSFDGCGILEVCETAEAWLESLNRSAPNKTPSSTYLMVNEMGTIYGIVNIRHNIDNERLKSFGGHIGYTIRPHSRKRGYGKYLLHLALEKCAELGLEKVLVTCDATNVASEKIIIANGGKYSNTVMEGKTYVNRYWIEVSNANTIT